MVHIICWHCKRIIHLEDNRYWNFGGTIECSRCGKDMKVEIKNGEIIKEEVDS
ncbi:MAG: hypothetical protein ACFE7E_05180 [Candidatus Hodarchaeota archaeon]